MKCNNVATLQRNMPLIPTVINTGSIGCGDSIKTDRVDDGILRFQKITADAFAPTYGSAKAAGADLYSAEDCIIPAKGIFDFYFCLGKYCVSTAIRVAIPDGCYGRIAPRSGLAVKNFIDVGAGVIDSDYRGELKILLFNFGNEDFQVRKGDRIAQLICEKFQRCEILESHELEETARGAGGFGSTGK
uniref:Deoxyuridine 5'-triphosphate nucleotidohydrolase n=1 Tax=Syphacia muris TaxID=451379 RepID=A0A0N5AU59_9BILA